MRSSGHVLLLLLTCAVRFAAGREAARRLRGGDQRRVRRGARRPLRLSARPPLPAARRRQEAALQRRLDAAAARPSVHDVITHLLDKLHLYLSQKLLFAKFIIRLVNIIDDTLEIIDPMFYNFA